MIIAVAIIPLALALWILLGTKRTVVIFILLAMAFTGRI